MRTRVWFPAVIFILFLGLIVQGSLELSTDAMLFPYILGAFGLALLAGQIVREARGARQAASEEEPGRASFNLGTYLPSIAWLLAILPMIYLVGYLITVPLYMFLYLKLHGERWPLCIAVTLLVSLVLYFAFIVALGIPFYEGLLFS